MGQATHPLMLHVGKSQLWDWGSSVFYNENLYAWQTRRTLLGIRYVLAFLNGLLIVHSGHLWAPKYWTGGCLYRQKKHFNANYVIHMPNLIKTKIKRRYYRYTPRRSGFFDGENFFFEFAMDRRWLFFKLYVWGYVHIFRYNTNVIVCCGGVPINKNIIIKKRGFQSGCNNIINLQKNKIWF